MSSNRRKRVDAIATQSSATPAATGSDPLSVMLRQRTRAAHRRAENSGVIRRLIQGDTSRAEYACYLRNLHPVYAALENGLAALRPSIDFAVIADPALARCAALESDLLRLAGDGWKERIALLPEAEAYARWIARSTTPRLVAHAYVRYLGDLNGGTILKRLLRESPGLGDDELGFYEFPSIDDIAACRLRFKACLDELGATLDRDAVVDEALKSFELATGLSVAIDEAFRQVDAGDRQSA